MGGKITAGMVAAALSFLFAFLLQMYLDETESSCHGRVSIAWQIPQLLLISFAEVLVTVTGLEFAYSQSPSELRFQNNQLFVLCINYSRLCHALL